MPFFKSLESYPGCNDKTASVNTVKTEQLPTEKLFGLVMIFGRHENLTFTQLEQRPVKIHRGLTSDGFLIDPLSFMPKFKDNLSVMNPNLVCL